MPGAEMLETRRAMLYLCGAATWIQLCTAGSRASGPAVSRCDGVRDFSGAVLVRLPRSPRLAVGHAVDDPTRAEPDEWRPVARDPPTLRRAAAQPVTFTERFFVKIRCVVLHVGAPATQREYAHGRYIRG
jgi:hypothetical protein